MPDGGGEGGRPRGTAHADALLREGKLEPALRAYESVGAFGQAARIARQLNRPDEAAALYSRAGEWYRAAVFYRQLGEDEQCLVNLLRVSTSDASYRAACLTAIPLAAELGRLDEVVLRFAAPFAAQPPSNDREADALEILAAYRRARGDLDAAVALLAAVVAAFPGRKDAAAGLRELRATGIGSGAPLGRRTGDTVAYDQRHRMPHTPVTAPAKAVAPPGDRAVVPPPPPLPTPPSESAGLLREGAVVGDRFVIEAKIGQGGMASVYRAFDRWLSERVAIKFFVPADESLAARFKQEVTILRRLNHPNIVRLFEFGAYYDYLYVTMELLEGQDLGKLLAGRAVGFQEGLHYLEQACGALQHVHDHGITHRDIKPGNFFVLGDGTLKVMDFGIAKRWNADALTRTGQMGGTPEYMAPEQFGDFKSVNHLADLYALGCVAYRMFTGRPPFMHEGFLQILVMHSHDAPRPPRELNADIPVALERLTLTLLAKAPSDRVQSCRELAVFIAAIRAALPG